MQGLADVKGWETGTGEYARVLVADGNVIGSCGTAEMARVVVDGMNLLERFMLLSRESENGIALAAWAGDARKWWTEMNAVLGNQAALTLTHKPLHGSGERKA